MHWITLNNYSDWQLFSAHITIPLEGGIAMDNLLNLPQALFLLFGLSYALHLKYPKAMKKTLNFSQQVMLGLGENKLTPKLQPKKSPVELEW